MKKIKFLSNIPAILWGALILIIIFIIFAPNFVKLKNIDNILKNSSILLIIAVGMTMSILSGEIDLSIGGVMSAAGMIAALYLGTEKDPGIVKIIVAIIIGTGVGLVFGLFNGLLIGKLRFNYMLVTVATMSLGFGLAQIVTNGYIIAGFDKSFRNVADGKIFGISSIIFIALVIVGFMIFITRRTRYGMQIYAVGDSEQCAFQSGINTNIVRFKIYAISGMLAGLGGVLLMSKTNSASAVSGTGYEFDAIAAVVVGGTSFEGGKGGLVGTVIGAIVIAAIKSGLQLIGLSNYWQQTFIGVFILAIIVFDVVSQNIKKTNASRRIYKND